jgi:hypothetical protein
LVLTGLFLELIRDPMPRYHPEDQKSLRSAWRAVEAISHQLLATTCAPVLIFRYEQEGGVYSGTTCGWFFCCFGFRAVFPLSFRSACPFHNLGLEKYPNLHNPEFFSLDWGNTFAHAFYDLDDRGAVSGCIIQNQAQEFRPVFPGIGEEGDCDFP